MTGSLVSTSNALETVWSSGPKIPVYTKSCHRRHCALRAWRSIPFAGALQELARNPKAHSSLDSASVQRDRKGGGNGYGFMVGAENFRIGPALEDRQARVLFRPSYRNSGTFHAHLPRVIWAFSGPCQAVIGARCLGGQDPQDRPFWLTRTRCAILMVLLLLWASDLRLSGFAAGACNRSLCEHVCILSATVRETCIWICWRTSRVVAPGLTWKSKSKILQV